MLTKKFQRIAVTSLRIDPFSDSDKAALPGPTRGYIVKFNPEKYFWGVIEIQETKEHPISEINAKNGAEMCQIDAPNYSIVFEDFYVKEITTRTSGEARDDYGDPFSWNAEGHLDTDNEKMYNDLINTIWIIKFRFTGMRMIKNRKSLNMDIL